VKVVQLLPELNEGGVERGVVELNREFVKRGVTSIVISAGGKQAAQIDADGGKHVQYDVASKNPLTSLPRMLGLRKLLKGLKPDIIHARSRVPAWLAFLANKKLQLPFVTTVHGLNSVNAYSRVMTFGDRVIVVGDPVRDHIVKNYSFDRSKVRVIQRGVDLAAFDPAMVDREFIAEFKNRYRLEDKYIVASVGRVTWLKDYETFIESISRLKEQFPDLVGLIVGGARADKTEYLQELKGLAEKLGVEERVIFAGSQSKIAEIYALSDVLVNASLKMGNIGRTIVEAFALDTPVIATTYDGLTDLVEDGINGYLIRTRDPEDLAEKIKLVRCGQFSGIRDHLNPDYTLATMVEKTLATYRELL